MARLELTASIEKAFRDDEGKAHIIAIVSDDTEDRHGDRMTELAIDSMAQQVTEKRIPLLENHRATFEMGHSVRGAVEKLATGRNQLAVEFELDERFQEMAILFEDVMTGTPNKQLSIGGFIPKGDSEAILYEKREDGSIRRALNKILLDHIALTRVHHAANDNTHIRAAIRKALDSAELELENEASTLKRNFPKAGATADWFWDQTRVAEVLRIGGKAMMNDCSLSHKTDEAGEYLWFGVHHAPDTDGVVKTFFKGVLAATEQLLIDQWNSGAFGLSSEKVRQCAEHLIAHFEEFNVELPFGLKALLGDSFESWTPEAKSAWDLYKESTLANLDNRESEDMDKTESQEASTVEEIEMVEETEKATETKSVSDVLKSVNTQFQELEVTDDDKESMAAFLDDLVKLFGLDTFKKEETEKVEDVESEKEDTSEGETLSPQEQFLSFAEQFMAATKSIDGLKEDVASILKAQADSFSTALTEIAEKAVTAHKEEILKAVEDAKTEINSKVEKLEKRVQTVEEMEGVSASNEKEASDDAPVSDQELFGTIFKNARQVLGINK